MRSNRYTAVMVLLFLAVVLAAPRSALSFQPSKPVEVVVHGGPGSGVDLYARAIAVIVEKEKLQGQRMQVLNKTGGNGTVAMAYLAEKKGETHTIGIFTISWVVAPLTSAEAKVTMKDLTPVARLVIEPSVAVVKADSPYNSIKDFIEAAQKTPGQLKQSGGSFTSADNLTRLLMQKATGAKWVFISFPGGAERISNLLGGHVQIMLMQPQEAGEHIRAGNLRVIAALTEKRLAAFPDILTIGEQGINIPIPEQARGIVAPPGVPRDVAGYWEDLFARVVKTASWKKYLEDNQLEDSYLNSSELGKFVEDYTTQMRVLLKEAGAKVMR